MVLLWLWWLHLNAETGARRHSELSKVLNTGTPLTDRQIAPHHASTLNFTVLKHMMDQVVEWCILPSCIPTLKKYTAHHPSYYCSKKEENMTVFITKKDV